MSLPPIEKRHQRGVVGDAIELRPLAVVARVVADEVVGDRPRAGVEGRTAGEVVLAGHASAGAPSPVHGLVVLALTDAGQLVSVTALAPRALFDSLDLTSAVASLRLSKASG